MRDRTLPEPFRSWIDPAIPLPPDVHILPRTINVTFDYLMFFMLGGMFAGMAALILTLFPYRSFSESWPLFLPLSLISLLLLLVPFFLLRRLVRTLVAARQKERGTLRQGILIGPQGLLVRIEPNTCHPIPVGRFVTATTRTSGGGSSDTEPKDYFRIETFDGPIEFFLERIAESPSSLLRHARTLRWKVPET